MNLASTWSNLRASQVYILVKSFTRNCFHKDVALYVLVLWYFSLIIFYLISGWINVVSFKGFASHTFCIDILFIHWPNFPCQKSKSEVHVLLFHLCLKHIYKCNSKVTWSVSVNCFVGCASRCSPLKGKLRNTAV